MPWLKGTDIVSLKRIFQKIGPKMEHQFLKALPVELIEEYHSLISSSKMPVEKMELMYTAAADVLFPEESDRILKLGRWMAETSLSTVYKIFVRIPTRRYIINRAPIIWRSYHEKGNASVENLTRTSGDFVVREYPELPRVLRLAAGGHLMHGIMLSGGKNVTVEHAEEDPHAWRWHVRWEV